MDAASLNARENIFAGTGLSNISDQALADIWDWCVIDGCRPVCLAGRLFMKTGRFGKFRCVSFRVLSNGGL